MDRMKRSLTIWIFILLVQPGWGQDERLSIVASASMIADIAQNIVGDRHDISMIVPIGGDPHLHEPTPSNAQMVAKADLILINGLTFEGWINELIENSGTKAPVVTVTEGVDVLTSQTYLNSADPHAWMDASNGIIYATNITQALQKLDPEYASQYEARLVQYSKILEKLDAEIQEAILTIPEAQRILITSHDAFQYYGRKYGIRLEAIMGISTEAEAQTSDIMRVNKVIKEQKVPAVFVESTINPKLIKQLAADNKVSIGGSLYADSLGDEDSPASTYIDMLRYNTNTIVSALSNTDKVSMENDTNKTNFRFILSLGIILFLGLAITVYFFNK